MFRRVLIPIAIAAVMLLALEGLVRIAFPQVGPLDTDRRLIRENAFGASAGIAPNVAALSNGVTFQSDAYGFWRYNTPADSALPAWLLIGDSVTMGIGVPPDSTFGGILAAEIDSAAVINASLIGYSVSDYANAVEALLAADAPHPYQVGRVTVFWCLNDIYADLPAGNPNQRVRRSLGPLLTWIRRHFYTYQWLKNAITDRPADYYTFDRAFYETDKPYLERSIELIERMNVLARRMQISFEVVLLPYRHQLTADDGDVMLPQRLLTEQLQVLGIATRDLADLAAATDRPERLYRFGDGIHFSAYGHRKVAERLMSRSEDRPAGGSD